MANITTSWFFYACTWFLVCAWVAVVVGMLIGAIEKNLWFALGQSIFYIPLITGLVMFALEQRTVAPLLWRLYFFCYVAHLGYLVSKRNRQFKSPTFQFLALLLSWRWEAGDTKTYKEVLSIATVAGIILFLFPLIPLYLYAFR